jgi:mono/diheme cytochrome c family protein
LIFTSAPLEAFMAQPDSMESGPGARALLWFRRFVWLGIIANIIITLTSIFCTEWVLGLLELESAYPLVWPRFGAFGILLLTGFYLVAARDPCGSRWATLFTVLCRFAGFILFAIVGGRYLAFGLFDLVFGAPQAICLYLAWRRTKDAAQGRAPGGRLGAVAMAVLFLAMFVWGLLQFLPAPVLRPHAADEEFFKYGSIGNDGAAGIPYPIWVALPDVCAKHLPPGGKGYASFGFLWERGRNPALDTPVGFSRVRVGVERMSINCALCHTARARLAPDAEPTLHAGGAGNTIDIQGYQRFLSTCAADAAFNGDDLIAAMSAKLPLSWAHRLLYRSILIPIVRKQLIKQGEEYAWSRQRPTWGPGRIDPFNPVKFGMLKLADDGTVGNSDMLSLWNVAERERSGKPKVYHWDGLTNSLRDSVLSSMLGDGMVAKEYKPETLTRLQNYLRTLRPPPSPHRPDAAAIERGRALFKTQCADCHATEGARSLSIIPPGEIGTDIQRGLMWTEAAAQAYNAYREGYDWKFSGFAKRDGYFASTLDGLWLSGPYLHNGAVPSLRDLLKVPTERPAAFVRGSDVVDGKNGGFVSPPCDPITPPPGVFCYDTSLIGNSNAGHLYGTALSAAEKEDLLAYLLTL